MKDKKKAKRIAIGRTIEDAKYLSENTCFSQMVSDHDGGMTYGQIAVSYEVALMFGLYGKSSDPARVAESIVGQAMRRFHPNPTTRREISKDRSLANLVSGRGHFQYLDADERIEMAQAGAAGRGRSPVTYEEGKDIMLLSLDSKYQGLRGIDAVKLASEINIRYHSGDTVRTPKAMSCYVSKIKNKKS